MTHPLLDVNARLVIAHRGNRVGAPENTVVALREAVDLGVDGLEFDVRITRDGVPVLMHDPMLERTTTGRGRLAEVDVGELRALSVRGPGGSAAASVPVPTLEEVLDQFRKTPLVLDVKELGAVDATLRLIQKFGLASNVVVGADDRAISARLYRSGIPACASRVDAFMLIPMALAGITPPAGDYSVLSITTQLLGVPLPVRRMAEVARRRGAATHVWTVNEPAEARRLWSDGVAAVITDDPAAILRARSQ